MVANNKRKLLVHVGMGKTGSSSIQKTLLASKKCLRTNGVLYLGLMLEQYDLKKDLSWHVVNGWGEYLSLSQEQKTIQLTEAFQQINSTLPDHIHTLIWSNESLFSSPTLLMDALVQLNSIFEIEIVAYIRSPGSWIVSAYLQWGVKHKTYDGELKSFEEWVENQRYSVTPMISLWKQVTDSVAIYNFEGISDVSMHFAQNHISDLANNLRYERANETPSPAALAMFAYHNSLNEGQVLPNELEPLLRVSGLMDKQQTALSFNSLLPTPKDISSFIEISQNEINSLNSFFQSTEQPEFDTAIKQKNYAVEQADIDRALLQIIYTLSSQVKNLRARLTRIEQGR